MGKDDFLAIRPQLPRLTKFFSSSLSFIPRPPILSYFVRFVPLVSLSPFAQNPSRASPPRLPPSLIFGSRIDVPRPQTNLPSSSLCPSLFPVLGPPPLVPPHIYFHEVLPARFFLSCVRGPASGLLRAGGVVDAGEACCGGTGCYQEMEQIAMERLRDGRLTLSSL